MGNSTAAWTDLTLPKITEGVAGDIGLGVHYLDLPSGWEYDTGTPLSISILSGTGMGLGSVYYSSATRIVFIIATQSSSGPGRLTFSDIRGRPTGYQTSTGNITYSGAGISGVDGSTNFGTLTTVSGAVNKIAFTTQPSSTAVAGSVFSTQPVVASQDKFGNTRTADTNTITLSSTIHTHSDCDAGSEGGQLQGTNTEAEVLGVADFAGNGLNYQVAETIYIEASDGTRTTCSAGIAVSPAAAHTVTIGTQPISGGVAVTSPLATQPIAHVHDEYGNHVSGVTVTAVLVTGGGSLRNNTAVTNANGDAIFSGLGYSKSGQPFDMKFTAPGAPHDSATSNEQLDLTTGALNYITVSEGGSITADETRAFTAGGFDVYGNSRGDVTGSTVFTIDAGAGGTFSGGATYTPQTAGSWTVTGTDGVITDTASLTVTPGALSSIVVTPDGDSITADQDLAFFAQGFDAKGNSRGSVTSGTTFSISAGAGGTWGGSNNATYTAEHASATPWTVTGTDGAFSDTTSLTVTPGAVASIVISPTNSSMTADETKNYTAIGYDADMNAVGDVTASTVFSDDSTGTWGGTNNATFTAVGTGSITITGTYTGGVITNSTGLTVTHGAANKYVIINPTDGTVDAAIEVTVQLQDADGNLITTGPAKDVDVRLVSGSNSFNFGVVDISNGVGSRYISDHVAETVGLSLTDIQVIGLDVSSTQNVVFAHGTATKYVIIDPTDGTVDASIPVTVELQDQYGNLITTGADKDKDVTLQAGGAATGYGRVDIINGTGHLDISDQVAQTVAFTLSDNYETHFNVASTQNVIFAPGAANHLEYTVQPASTVVAGVVSLAPTVAVHDQYNNVRTQSTDTITMSAYSNDTCTTVGTVALNGGHEGLLTKAEVAGVADFSADGGADRLGYTKTGNLYIKASDGTRTTCSTAVLVTHNTASKLALSASPTSLLVGANSTLTALVQDVYGNTATSDETTYITLSSDGNSIRSTQNGKVASGTRTFLLSDNTAETVNASITSNPWLTPSSEATVTFTATDVTAPTISSINPDVKTGTVTGIAITVTPTITFSEALDRTTVTPTSVCIVHESAPSTCLSATVSMENGDKTVRITPSTSLLNNNRYEIYVTTAVKDASGVAFASTYTSSFLTTVAADVAPTVTAQSPSDNATSTAITVTPTITFSTAMDAATLNGGTIQLRKYSDDTAVGASISYNPTSYVVTLTPNASLANNTQYYIWVSGAKNAAGTTVAAYATKANQEFTTTVAGVGTFGIISTTMTKMTGTADNTYTNGWEWVIRMTLPTNQNDFALKFTDWVSGSNTLAAASNMEYYSEQIASGTGSAGTPVAITAASTYPSNVTVSTDVDPNTAGIQTDVHVKVKIPASTANGSYSTSYRVNYE